MNSQNTKEKDTHSELAEQAEHVEPSSRRRFLANAAVPAVLTLASRPVFGTSFDNKPRCTISGFTSVNPSGVTRHTTEGCAGLSHGAWRNPYSGNGDGSVSDWITAGQRVEIFTDGEYSFPLGFIPYPPGATYTKKNGQLGTVNANNTTLSQYNSYFNMNVDLNDPSTYLPNLTNFQDIFGSSGPNEPIHQVLLNNDSGLDFDALAAFMSASLYEWDDDPSKIHPLDIVGLYKTPAGANYTTTSGNTVLRGSNQWLADFFKQLQH